MSSLDRIEARERTERLYAAQENCKQAEVAKAQYPQEQAYLGASIPGAGTPCEARETAHQVLYQRIWALTNEAEQLQALVRSLPAELPYADDLALVALVRASFTR